jgi:pyruvate, orthophosphate dikinase
MGKPCIVGCGDMTINAAAGRAQLGATAISEGDWITLDGDGGRLYLGRLETAVSRPEAELAEVESWRSQAHEHDARKHNAPQPHSAQV